MSTVSLSSHVLDLQNGRPASALNIAVHGLEPLRLLATATTDTDGRVTSWSPVLELPPGLYQLTFDTGAWFAAQGELTLYPRIQICFTVVADQRHYHIPLLLNAFGYSTYRGS